MIAWLLIDYREQARGYSLGMHKALNSTDEACYRITLYLDNVPYWVYPDLKQLDAELAMDDLEMSPGPRGDSSWRAVLARCMLKEVSIPRFTPVILQTNKKTDIGTWEWVQSLANARLNPQPD